MGRLKMYELNPDYIKYLSQFQNHIFDSSGDKTTRKYIGIILQIDDIRYFAPLSSFKNKHKTMKESVDFIKIKNYAVLNINNMIPVPEGEYHLVDINGTKDASYKFLLQTESRELNKQRHRILKNAAIVHTHKLKYVDSTLLAKRTNNFILLERKCKEFSSIAKHMHK